MMPRTIARLTELSADVFAVGFPFASFLPFCSSVVLSAVRLSSSTIADVSSMSSLELRSAVLVIHVRTSWSV
jgi:hypothetical protein